MTPKILPPELLRLLTTISESPSAGRPNSRRPVIGTQISLVQRLFGGPLFETTANGARLTQLGMVVHDLARQALAFNDAILQLHDSQADRSDVRLGMNSMLLEFFAGAVDNPTIENLSVTSNTCSVIVKEFGEREIDVALVLDVKDHRVNLADSIVAEFEIDFAWIQTGDFVLCPEKPVPLAIWPADQMIFLDRLSKVGLAYRLMFSSPDYFAKLAAVKSGKCLAVIPREAIAAPFIEAKQGCLPTIEPKKVLLAVRGDPTSDRLKPVVAALSLAGLTFTSAARPSKMQG